MEKKDKVKAEINERKEGISFFKKIMNIFKEECRKWYLEGYCSAKRNYAIDLTKITNKKEIFYHPSSKIHLNTPLDLDEIDIYMKDDDSEEFFENIWFDDIFSYKNKRK